MDSSSSGSHQSEQSQSDAKRPVPATSYLKTTVTIFIWVELILGLSAISSAAFLNRRVPVWLYSFYAAYLAFFLWFLYSSCRKTYLQTGPLNYTYLIFGGCTIATIGVVLTTFLTAPNSGEIAFISLIVFFISLVLFPFICAIFYCFLRGSFIMPTHMRSKPGFQTDKKGVDQADTSTTELQKGFHAPTEV